MGKSKARPAKQKQNRSIDAAADPPKQHSHCSKIQTAGEYHEYVQIICFTADVIITIEQVLRKRTTHA